MTNQEEWGSFAQPNPEWDITFAYNLGDEVRHNGLFYECILDNTAVEPGVTGGWDTYWEEVDAGPPAPTDVEVDVGQTRIHVSWDAPVDADDEDSITDGGTDADDASSATLDEDIAFFQVHLATDVGFTTIIRRDRSVKSNHKNFRVKKPSGDYYARVRSVSPSGQKSVWVDNTAPVPTVPAPTDLVLKFRKQGSKDKVKAVLIVQNVTWAEEDISRYQFQLREVEFDKLAADITAAAGSFTIVGPFDEDEVPMNPTTDSPDFTAFIGKEELLVTSISGAQDLTWHATRAQNGTTAKAWPEDKRVYYFGKGTQAENRMVTEEPSSTETRGIIAGCATGLRYTARVRAIDSQNRRSAWSDWTGIVKAVAGNSASTTGPSVDNDEPPTEIDYPYERVVRFRAGVDTGATSEVVAGLEATVTAARALVDTAPTTDATVDVNIDAVSVLTLTIPADAVMSDLTWVDAPGDIGQKTGAQFEETNELSVTQTDMQDATGTLDVYVQIYLSDGT